MTEEFAGRVAAVWQSCVTAGMEVDPASPAMRRLRLRRVTQVLDIRAFLETIDDVFDNRARGDRP